ncbi:MAG: hypothetical protein JHC54_14845, partial [Acinetobacter sp.]|nr:hypothetical protein [Acinetobacter sp.]
IKKANNNDPYKRFQSASEFRQAIEKIVIPIDWRPIDDDSWVGTGLNSESYELKKQPKRNGWIIEYKKNGRRIKENCRKELSDSQVTAEFFKIISSSNA